MIWKAWCSHGMDAFTLKEVCLLLKFYKESTSCRNNAEHVEQTLHLQAAGNGCLPTCCLILAKSMQIESSDKAKRQR